MVWSFSRITTFDTCKYSFYLQYLLKNRELYPPESNYWAEVGSFVHKILEMIFNGELTIDDAPQYYLENFERNVITPASEKTMANTYEACADYLAVVDFEWLRDYEILGVEKELDLLIAGYRFTGYIDLLLRHKVTGDIIVVDHKSSQYPMGKRGGILSNCRHKFESYKKQMYLYSYGVYEEYGIYPKEIWWNHFKDGGKFIKIPFNEKEYRKAIDWLIDSIHQIEHETEYPANNTDENYFYCMNLCNFRGSCEYAPKNNPNRYRNRKRRKRHKR